MLWYPSTQVHFDSFQSLTLISFHLVYSADLWSLFDSTLNLSALAPLAKLKKILKKINKRGTIFYFILRCIKILLIISLGHSKHFFTFMFTSPVFRKKIKRFWHSHALHFFLLSFFIFCPTWLKYVSIKCWLKCHKRNQYVHCVMTRIFVY